MRNSYMHFLKSVSVSFSFQASTLGCKVDPLQTIKFICAMSCLQDQLAAGLWPVYMYVCKSIFTTWLCHAAFSLSSDESDHIASSCWSFVLMPLEALVINRKFLISKHFITTQKRNKNCGTNYAVYYSWDFCLDEQPWKSQCLLRLHGKIYLWNLKTANRNQRKVHAQFETRGSLWLSRHYVDFCCQI